MPLPSPCFYLVTSRRALAPDARTERDALLALDRQLARAIEGGIDVIQIRERDLEARDLRDLVSRTLRLAQGTPVRILVNDRADVAAVAGAHGVHLRADGPPVAHVRQLLDPAAMIGRSVHSVREAESAGEADYLLVGTVYPSPSKPAGAPVSGVEVLAAIAQRVTAPVLAIGGVTVGRVGACRRAGAAGVAAIGAFLQNPAATVAAMRQAWADSASEPPR